MFFTFLNIILIHSCILLSYIMPFFFKESKFGLVDSSMSNSVIISAIALAEVVFLINKDSILVVY